MNVKEIFIANLKKFRKMGGVSQMKLAEYCDTPGSYIGEIEIGRKFPSIGMIERIARALRVEVWQLFKAEDTPGQDKNREARELFARLSPDDREALADLIMLSIRQSLEKAVFPQPAKDE